MEFRLATGNAGTGMYQRGTDEHGCEFVPVADGQIANRNSLVPLAGLMWHPYPADSTVFQSKQAKDSLQSRKTCT